MIRVKDNGLPRMLITVFTTLILMVSFCLWDGEVERLTGSTIRGTDGITGWVGSFIPSLAEEPVLFTKNGSTQFTPLRTGFQRIFIPCGNHGAVPAFYQPPLGTNSTISCYIIDVKNTIFLKLRI
jgi:hypothetical protein